MERTFSDQEISTLLEESIKKIQSTADADTKKLTDMSNALNWILTLTTLFFVYMNQQKFDFNYHRDVFFSFTSKSLFVISTLNLIIHKFLFIKYEEYKSQYLGGLKTQYVDFKINIAKVKEQVLKIKPFNTIEFINAHRDGKLAYNSVRNVTINDFKKIDKKISMYSKILKLSFNIGMTLFIVYFTVITYLIFH